MEEAQNDISGLITNLVTNASSFMSKIEDEIKAMGPIGYIMLALVMVVIVAAFVVAAVASGGAIAALGFRTSCWDWFCCYCDRCRLPFGRYCRDRKGFYAV